MKLLMTLVVRDEADIIAANLDYHLAQGVDFVIVTDHASSDGTGEILHAYERRGVAQVIRDEDEGHHQSRRVTRMAEMAGAEHGADWVIHNDADEFWWPMVGSLREVFAALPERWGQVYVPRRNFRPLAQEPDEASGEPFYSRLIYREAVSPNIDGQAKVAHRPRAGVIVKPGNHGIAPELPAVPVPGLLEIFHFPMRSYAQFESKVVRIGQGYEVLTDRSPGVGDDQLRTYELQRAGGLPERWESLALDAQAIEQGLESGELVIDRRLADFMQTVALSTHAAEHRADAPHAGELLAHTMSSTTELLDAREQLRVLRPERDHLIGDVADLKGALERSGEVVEDVKARMQLFEEERDTLAGDLEKTAKALQELRDSRIVRYSAPARHAFHAATGRLRRG